MATQVRRTPTISVAAGSPETRALTKALFQELTEILNRLREVFPKDGTEALTGPLPLMQYPTASLPNAALFEGHIVYDSTTQTVKYSDGATWQSL